MRLSSAPVIPAFSSAFVSCDVPVVSPSQLSLPTTTPSSVDSSIAPEPAAASPLARGPVIVFVRERLALRDAEFAELDKDFLAREDCVPELKSCLVKSVSTEANPALR